MLHEPGAPNIAAFENQVKHHTLSDHWKSIKTLFLEKNNSDLFKKDKKRLTGIQGLTNDFTFFKMRYKSLRKRK